MALKGRDPGRMDLVMTLLEPTQGQDATTNAATTSFASPGTVRAERILASSSEQLEGQQQVGKQFDRFRIRNVLSLYAIDQTWRFQVEGVTYDVRGVDKEGRKNFLIVTGEARDN